MIENGWRNREWALRLEAAGLDDLAARVRELPEYA
jgi:hypothetical protein